MMRNAMLSSKSFQNWLSGSANFTWSSTSIQSAFAIRSLSWGGKNACIPGSSSQMSAVSDRNRRPEYYQWFRQDIDHIAQDGGQSTISLTTYLNREWFSHWWRLYCVDYGTQAHLTRDGALSTNNLAEASFKTFDRVFLSCRVNKRSVSLEVTSET